MSTILNPIVIFEWIKLLIRGFNGRCNSYGVTLMNQCSHKEIKSNRNLQKLSGTCYSDKIDGKPTALEILCWLLQELYYGLFLVRR